MPVEHEKELREIAQRARELAERINQDGPPNQFQTAVRSELPTRLPDIKLQNIEVQLENVATDIRTYLRRRAGY